MNQLSSPLGDQLRTWRQRRHLSQLDLALDAEISTRHLSFMETGRARPSREMVLRLAERLEVPLRERNTLLVAAGFAPVFPQRDLGHPALSAARKAVDLILTGHEPFPALAVDRGWNLVAANRAVAPLMAGVDPQLLAGQVNVLRLSLHPLGLAPRIVNLDVWRTYILERLRREIDITADEGLAALLSELRAFPGSAAGSRATQGAPLDGIAMPLEMQIEGQLLSFLVTTTVFGTATEITLSELTLETFFPANAETAAAIQSMARTVA
ncbi:helix-turn-helix domain-containing protein [Phenylobacterium sp.]|jgi:transcriptional regulator with XRE-family HTH domain|uniref:helix-turn-helix domain-containing protein n=1 Tax=Phenylobacterium sp. TaxID=1871053 RepID=UPI0037C545C2